MGIYLNPSNENFRQTLATGEYVDKTMMIAQMNRLLDTDKKYVCVSRPRRFGKTVTANMLCAYYSKGCESRGVFAPYMIAQDPGFLDHLNRYNVIRIDVNSEYQNIRDREHFIDQLTERIRKELREEYPEVGIDGNQTLADSILQIHSSTGESFIFMLDEYDVLVREQASDELFDSYLSFLNGLFKSDTLKPAISLAYLTGILPIVRDRIQSKLNNFDEYTILDADGLAEFIGFTSGEVQELCRQYRMDFEECRRWYDGYEQHGIEIYNPRSVMQAMNKHRCDGYWSQTSSYQAITDRIRDDIAGMRDDIVRMLSGERVQVDVGMYLNTMTDFDGKDEVYTYLAHLGYLAYDVEDGSCSIPNFEIHQEWQRAIRKESRYTATDDIIRSSKELLAATWRGETEKVAAALDESHMHVTSNRSYNNEDGLASAIYLAYIYALNRYTVIKEATAGNGFADVLFIPFVPDIPAMVVELKNNKTAESAINQIHDRHYHDALSGYKGNILLAGINYDEDTRRHNCIIEKA